MMWFGIVVSALVTKAKTVYIISSNLFPSIIYFCLIVIY